MAGDVRDPRLFDYDPLTGITEFYHFDPVTHGFVIETQQDISGLIELNKTVANDARGDWKGDLHHVASFPLTIVMELAKQGIMTAGGNILDDKKFRQWLNSPENAVWRVKGGKV